MPTHFADTILNISLTGPLVRMDLGTLTPVPGQDGKQELRATVTEQVVMPLEGFVRAFSLQETLIKKLHADGVIKARPAAAETASTDAITRQ